MADGTLVPETKDDFERMLIAQPNSSFLWVQYMAHHLQSAAVDAARAVAARALRTIDFREENVSRKHRYCSFFYVKAFVDADGNMDDVLPHRRSTTCGSHC